MPGIAYIELDLSHTHEISSTLIVRKGLMVPRFKFENRKEIFTITLGYGVEIGRYLNHIDTEVTISVNFQAWNSQVQCLLVDLPPSLPRHVSTPHITLSWVDGSGPVAAVDMLNIIGSTYEVARLHPFLLTGIVKFKAWGEVKEPQKVIKSF